jgi:phosphatidate cytidylyltransferase
MFAFANVWNAEDFRIESLPYYLGGMLFLSFFAAFISILFNAKKEVVPQLGKIFLSIMYIGVPFTLMVLIPFINHDFQYIHSTILGVFILVWINDTFAYVTGSLFGKHKLLERISPKKTIEGFIGGMFFAFVGAWLLSRFYPDLSLINWLVFAAIVSVFGVLGDLIESMFKRQAGVKDSGNLIPGHGGLLDRLDSVIFAAPFIFLYLVSVLE